MKKYLKYIHPFLFALYPVIFLYSKNIHEYTEGSIILPSIVSLIFGGIVFLISKLLLKKIDQAAIVASFVILSSLSFGRITSLTGLNNVILTPILLLILIGIVYFVKKTTKNLAEFNKLLVYLSTILIALSLFTIISFEIKTGRILNTIKPASQEQTKTSKKGNENDPDVYYFIFDRYAGPISQKTEFSIDNSQFFDFLKDKGFYVADEATTNYPKTFLSLGSSLNMEYLDFATEKTKGGASPDESIITPYIRNSKVLNFLKDRGYYIVNIGPKTWNPTSVNPNADKNYTMTEGTYPYSDPFATGYYNTTIAEPIFKKIFQNPLDVSKDPNNNEHRRLALFEINAVKEAIRLPGPKFVFVHILLPHDPFVFNENCNPVNEEEVNKHDHVYNYTQQLKCANKQMESIMSDILKNNNSKVKPIIVLQSDEGPFPMKTPIPPKQGWGAAKTASLKEKFPILNAFYLPTSTGSANLYPSITPVNNFRVIFNTYFGTNYPLLEDKNMVFKDEQNFYIFTDVTDRLK